MAPAAGMLRGVVAAAGALALVAILVFGVARRPAPAHLMLEPASPARRQLQPDLSMSHKPPGGAPKHPPKPAKRPPKPGRPATPAHPAAAAAEQEPVSTPAAEQIAAGATNPTAAITPQGQPPAQQPRQHQPRQREVPRLNLPSHKRVIIAGEGRSGSTLVGTLFRAPGEWAYYYEPLRYAFPPLERQVSEERRAANGDPPKRCSATYPRYCVAANAAALLEVLACERTYRPLELLMREISATAASAAEEERRGAYAGLAAGEQPEPDWSREPTAATGFLLASGLYTGPPRDVDPPTSIPPDDLPSADDVEAAVGECRNVTGVAAKIIRMTGRMEQLFNVVDALAVPLDLVVHLVRDPRALLASRWSVYWGTPKDRTYNSTLSWATTICDDMMADAAAGAGRTEYLLQRYEDLAENAEARARKVYDRMGSPTPDIILREARVYDGCINGTPQEIEQCVADRVKINEDENIHVMQYSTRPRNFTAMINKWQRVLHEDEVRAVEEACAEVFRFMYPHATLLHSKGG